MKRIIAIALLLAFVAVPRLGVSAQEDAPASNGCNVAPMAPDRIDELVAMATASPVAGLPTEDVTLPEGTSITVDVQAQLLDTLMQINACSWANDLPRLLSLYSERFIVNQVFAPESQPIELGSQATPTNATPAPMPTDQQPMIFAAVQLPDGRIAALVSSNSWGGNQQIVWFVQQDGRWLVDQTAPAAEDGAGGSTGAAIPQEAQTVVDLVLADAATQLGVDVATLTVSAIEQVDWSDSALGCPEEGGVYAQVISPGYRITVTDGTSTLEYHTGLNDAFVICAE